MRQLKRSEKRLLGDFAAANPCCWACGIADGEFPPPEIDYPRHLVIHHILKPGRIHAAWNLARLCSLCHDLAEGLRVAVVVRGRRRILPRLTLANVLYLKRQHDRQQYDRRELQEHTRAGRRLPRPARPAAWFLRQRECV